MSFDLSKILESKRLKRQQLAELSIAEKLRMLDVLRERELLLREAARKIERKEDDAPSRE